MINALHILLITAVVMRKGDYHDRFTQKLPGSWFGDTDAFIRIEKLLGELLGSVAEQMLCTWKVKGSFMTIVG